VAPIRVLARRRTLLVLVFGSALFGCAGTAWASVGTISTVAGDGNRGYSGDKGAATSAELTYPDAVATDGRGDLLISDEGNNVVRLVAAASCSSGCPYGLASMTKGDIYTVAGDGTAAYKGDGGPATGAELNSPTGVAVDAQDDLLIADDGNSVVRLVAASSCSSGCPYGLPSMTKGDIYTVAGDGAVGYSGDKGPATSAELNFPWGVAVDRGGDLLISDSTNSVVRLVAAADCSSSCPYGVASMTRGDIYTVAGDGTAGDTGDGAPASSAELNYPAGLTVDRAGNLVIVDESSSVVRVVSAASCSSSCPYGLASMTRGDIYTVGGIDGTFGYNGDARPATSADLNSPIGVAVDPGRNLLIADYFNQRVRMIAAASCSARCPYGLPSTTRGDIYTVAGNGTRGSSGNGGKATDAQLFFPEGVAVGGHGDLLIADTDNQQIRLVTGLAYPSLSLSAPASGTVDSAIPASAIRALLSGGSSPSRTITFKVFGPQSSVPFDCSGGTTVGTATVAGNGAYHPSVAFTPRGVGDYWWYAIYHGDSNNNPAISACGRAMAKTVIRPLPIVARLRVFPHRVSLAGRKVNGRCVKPTSQNSGAKPCRRPIRLKAIYTLDTATKVIFTVKRALPGRQVGSHCVKPTGQNRRQPHCARTIRVPGSITAQAHSGANTFIFTGAIGGHMLPPGNYRLTATPSPGGHHGDHRTAAFVLTG
jgi:hypothetical protein